jgi:heme-degrading monooxygenase HmoA
MTMGSVSSAGKTEIYASGSQKQMIVARIWRGQTRVQDAETYSVYLYEHGTLKIERMPGNLGVIMLKSIGDVIADFTVISFWPNRTAISSWSGDDLTRTRHLERDPEFLLALPERVELVDVVANDWLLPTHITAR